MDGYGAIVAGSGVYDGSWTADATMFVRRHAPMLAHTPVWLFGVGSFGDQHPVIGGLMRKEPKEMGEFEQAIHPRDYRVFAGVIDLAHWPAWGRLLFQALGGRDGDNRSWPDIEAWADQIAHALGRVRPNTRGGRRLERMTTAPCVAWPLRRAPECRPRRLTTLNRMIYRFNRA